MKVLVLGSGAREHALAWKIRQSPNCDAIFCHPGNAGIFRDPILTADLPLAFSHTEVVQFCKHQGITLVVIGPETLLGQGFGDLLRQAGIKVVGPNRAASRLETSKLFAKEFMVEFGIPTGRYQVATSFESLAAASSSQMPIVLKYDGLASGKGVVIAQNKEDVLSFAQRVYGDNEFGTESRTVLIEEFIPGTEISYIGLCDGSRFIALESATDYKRIFDGGEGPNTGGMGAVSPSPFLTPQLKEAIDHSIIAPILKGLKARDIDYRGALFIGLMIDPSGRAFVLEFNVRFGDPETQAILLRLESDILELLLATAAGELSILLEPRWSSDVSVYVVATSDGYPGKPKTGTPISGLETLPDHAQLFSAAMDRCGTIFSTSGGRVLGIGAKSQSVSKARRLAYDSLSQIHWAGMHFRNDIGKDI